MKCVLITKLSFNNSEIDFCNEKAICLLDVLVLSNFVKKKKKTSLNAVSSQLTIPQKKLRIPAGHQTHFFFLGIAGDIEHGGTTSFFCIVKHDL